MLKAKSSVRRAAFLSESRKASRKRTCRSIEPLVSQRTTRRGSSMARVRRASRRISPSVATARRRLRRGSMRPRPRVGTSRRLFRVASASASRASSRSISARSRSVHSSKGFFAQHGLRAVAGRVRAALVGLALRSSTTAPGRPPKFLTCSAVAVRRPGPPASSSRRVVAPPETREELLESLRVASPDLQRDFQGASGLRPDRTRRTRASAPTASASSERPARTPRSRRAPGESGHVRHEVHGRHPIEAAPPRPVHEAGELGGRQARRCRCDP